LNYVEVEHFRLTRWAWPTGCSRGEEGCALVAAGQYLK
jgi:hypothetical protein